MQLLSLTSRSFFSDLSHEKSVNRLSKISSLVVGVIFGLSACGVSAESSHRVKVLPSKEATAHSVSTFLQGSISLTQIETYEQIAQLLVWQEPVIEANTKMLFSLEFAKSKQHKSNKMKFYKQISPYIRRTIQELYVKIMARHLEEVGFTLSELQLIANDPFGKLYFTQTHKKLKNQAILLRKKINEDIAYNGFTIDYQKISHEIAVLAKSELKT